MEWDTEAPTVEQAQKLFLNLVSLNRKRPFFMYIHTDPEILHTVLTAAASMKLHVQLHPWIKTGFSTPGAKKYVCNTEIILCIQFGADLSIIQKQRKYMPHEFYKRKTSFHTPRLTSSQMHCDDYKVVYNSSQKPWEIAYRYTLFHAASEGPDSCVLVLGAGSGSEIIGALAAGASVYAFELDPRQYEGAQSRVIQALKFHVAKVEE